MRSGNPFIATPWPAALLLAIVVYVLGLGGQYIPSNGDEMVYAHIARVTAQTGHWLPLASDLVDTRNTKPPLLFWQAMVAGHWGAHWSLTALRAPNVLYLLLVAGAIAGCVRSITRRTSDGLLAACLFLAFLSTFRYGRPYLTSAPETFWFSLPLLTLLWQRQRQPEASPSSVWLHILLGLGLGLGLAYKSFALVAPVCAAWWLALVLSDSRPGWRPLWQHTWRTGLSGGLALGVFGLWFVLDPDPGAVWREFIVGENASKFSDARGYWQEALSLNGSSVWSQLLAYAVNAGLLALPVIGLGVLGLQQLVRQRPLLRTLSPAQRILLAWAGVWLLVFLLPSQRSARYVIPAMPAVAMLLALSWQRIARGWFLGTALLCALALLILGRIAWVGYTLQLFTTLEITLAMGCAALGIAVVLVSTVRARWQRASSLWGVLLVYATFNLTVAPLDGPLGLYPPGATALAGTRIAVPNGFNSQFERFQFLLPGPHRFVPYETGARALARQAPGSPPPLPTQALQTLLTTHDAVVWAQSAPEETQAPCHSQCEVLAQRWVLKSRHLPGEVRLDNLWQPKQWLFQREWLLRRNDGATGSGLLRAPHEPH